MPKAAKKADTYFEVHSCGRGLHKTSAPKFRFPGGSASGPRVFGRPFLGARKTDARECLRRTERKASPVRPRKDAHQGSWCCLRLEIKAATFSASLAGSTSFSMARIFKSGSKIKVHRLDIFKTGILVPYNLTTSP